uniref:Secreted protein n=1 Tax=Globodera rostochiensis TaxID=31243 RepID=A0A914HKT5_GLORO
MELIFFVLIGVGAFLLVAVTAAGVVFLVLWRRRKQSQAAATVELPNYTLLSAAPMKSAGKMPSSLLSDETKKSAVPASKTIKTMWLPGPDTKGAPSAISTTKPKACIYGVAVPKTVWVSASKTKGASAFSTTKQPKASISGVQVPKAVSMAGKGVK